MHLIQSVHSLMSFMLCNTQLVMFDNIWREIWCYEKMSHCLGLLSHSQCKNFSNTFSIMHF